MTRTPSEVTFLEVLAELNDVPFACTSRGEGLRRIAQLGRRSLGSHACTLTLVDLTNRYLAQEACDGFDEEFDRRMTGRRVKIGQPSDRRFLHWELAVRAELIERYNLHHDGGGIANPRVATHYGLQAALCHPLKLDGQLVGFFNHFSTRPASRPFTATEKRRLALFASQAAVAVERVERRHFERSSNILATLSESLLAVTPQEFLKLVAERACELLSVPICIVWKRDERKHVLKIVEACGAVDEEYRRIELSLNDPPVREHQEYLVERKRVASLTDVRQSHKWYRHQQEAAARGWVSLMTAQMRVGHRTTGMLDVYTTRLRTFKEWEKKSFSAFADHAALSIWNFTTRRRLQDLNILMQQMTETGDADQLLSLILERGLALVGSDRGSVSKLDHQTGLLEIVRHAGEPQQLPALPLGVGITGRALREEKPLNVRDVHAPEWSGIYHEYWLDTESELAIPIIRENAAVRVSRDVRRASKLIGVLNIESPVRDAFSDEDVEIMQSLARQAAIIIERLELDRKQADLARIEKHMVEQRGYDAIMELVLETVTGPLGYEYVNVSEVLPELHRIKTTHVAGLPEHQVESFKKLADHSLDSDDIQAYIVRSNQAEVPGRIDARFDQVVYDRFGHRDLIRVFVPMRVPPDNRVVGTIEAGYKRRILSHIYEHDVQMLQGFVDYAALVLERQKGVLLEPITHEFRAPIVGIRNHASFIQGRLHTLPSDLIKRKLGDILTDCDLLLLKVGDLEYILGHPAPLENPTRTVVMRDVVIKAINQLRTTVHDQGFPGAKMQYDQDDIGKVILHVDRRKLSQVVMNLLTNAIKYADPDPQAFAIRVQVDETRDAFVLKFKDWGMGVKAGYEEEIFVEGFRTPEAIKKHVTGSGLGLAISRRIMRELGGDLHLAGRHKPTEFDMILPKTLKEAGRDPHGG
jgi:signal transduction histidine kinase/GAF domain-containing protein